MDMIFQWPQMEGVAYLLPNLLKCFIIVRISSPNRNLVSLATYIDDSTTDLIETIKNFANQVKLLKKTYLGDVL